jgi:hypothetical protein
MENLKPFINQAKVILEKAKPIIEKVKMIYAMIKDSYDLITNINFSLLCISLCFIVFMNTGIMYWITEYLL